MYYISVPPSFDSTPTNQTVIEGTNTTFHCTATGNPTPTITWMKDGKSVAEGHTFSFETSWNDSGKYWCLATNGLGETINTTFNLDVQCKLVKNLRKCVSSKKYHNSTNETCRKKSTIGVTSLSFLMCKESHLS